MTSEEFEAAMKKLGLGKDKDKYMRVKINPKKNFKSVFGADCFIEYYPALSTDEGVLVHKLNGFWYIWDTDEDWMVNDTAFFTTEDLEHLTIIRHRDHRGRYVKE